MALFADFPIGSGARRYSDERAVGVVFSRTSFFGCPAREVYWKTRALSGFLPKGCREAQRPWHIKLYGSAWYPYLSSFIRPRVRMGGDKIQEKSII
jgi:hypothetical protein